MTGLVPVVSFVRPRRTRSRRRRSIPPSTVHWRRSRRVSMLSESIHCCCVFETEARLLSPAGEMETDESSQDQDLLSENERSPSEDSVSADTELENGLERKRLFTLHFNNMGKSDSITGEIRFDEDHTRLSGALQSVLDIRVNHWIIYSTNSFKHLIHSETKHLTVLMSESLNHLFNRFNQTSDSFRNKAFDCVNEWITESFISTNSFKHLIHSETKHLTVNEWITESFISTDSIKHLIHSGTKHLTALMSESLNHFDQPIQSNIWFIQEQSIWLC